MADAVPELAGFLQDSSVPISLKSAAMKYALGMSATEEGIRFICQHSEFSQSIFKFASYGTPNELCEIAHNCLLNISGSIVGISSGLLTIPQFNEWLVTSIFELDSPFVGVKCKILANMTRHAGTCQEVADFFLQSPDSFGKLMFLFLSNESDMKDSFDYIALVYGNLSSAPNGKNLFIKNDCLKYLLPYTCHESDTRRLGIGILLKNISFNVDEHQKLLEEVEILPAILLALAGPEELSDEENEALPVDLQYLDTSKQHEPNPFIRMLLLEALLKLCSTRYGRKFLRDKGTYFILRELHAWDKHSAAKSVCDDVIEILIREETDINAENLSDVHIPQQFVDKFEQMSVTMAE